MELYYILGINMAENSRKSEKKDGFTFQENVMKYIEKEAKTNNMNIKDYFDDVFTNPYAIVEFEESTGKVALKAWNPDPTTNITAIPKDNPDLIKEYRELRDSLAPISAGINYHKRFMLGSGFTEEVDSPTDKHQLEMREVIKKFDSDVFQDYYSRGMRKILDLLIDEALTVGCAGAEIVYDADDGFEFDGFVGENGEPFVTGVIEYTIPNDPKGSKIKIYKTRDLEESDWKKLKGIVRLKFIEDGVSRMQPFREQDTNDLRYWIVDRQQQTDEDKLYKNNPRDDTEVHLHPWQVFWLTWNARGMNMHGTSLIRAVLREARLLRIIEDAMGKGYQRWSDKKYFFICGSDRRPWGKVSTRNFLKAMEQMIKNNWTGIPVPQGFDIKEIGGEVFDARNFLDFLSTLICSGMGYPKDFLLQESKSGAGSSRETWIAWQSTYGYNQDDLKQAIQTQLWEKQIWCKIGRNYKVARQGVPEANREVKSVFIPKVQWRSESKWLMETRLKMDAQVLNVANPASPQLKLGVEMDIAKTMGLTDIIFPTFEELETSLKTQEANSKLKLEIDKLRLQVEQKKLEFLIKNPTNITDPLDVEKQQQAQEALQEDAVDKKTGEPLGDNPKRPLPKPKKRLEGGVSRMDKETETPNAKGVAKSQGGTRQPASGV